MAVSIRKKILFPAIIMLLASSMPVLADVYTDYVEQYSVMAVEQQEKHGIPASITLAQGLLESAAGRSTLATRGNNHFGIKCHNTWRGDTMIRSDDRPDDCFRVYRNARESYEDHSNFLLKPRYSVLFELDPADYSGWATGLRKCGYATDPNYASRLVSIIERYALYLYDTPGGRDSEENAAYIQSMLASSHPVRRSRGLHYVIAAPGDTYAKLAREFKIDKKKLLEYNDMKRDTHIKDWEEVYLEPKLSEAPAGLTTAVIGEGESMHSLSQRYGMRLDVIRSLNPDVRDRAGAKIRLR